MEKKSPRAPAPTSAPISTPIPAHVKRLIREALKEDIGPGDVTTLLTVPEDMRSTAVLIAKRPLVLAGLPFAFEVFRALDRRAIFEPLAGEGQRVRRSEVFARVVGRTRALLSGERVALNILQRLSGIATLTSRFVREAAGTKARILDTRKTTPGLRWLEKYAVRAGGGENHRFGLYDAILIKDNHIEAAGGIGRAVSLARRNRRGLRIEVEAETLKDVSEALKAGAYTIMLDNMGLGEVAEAVRLVGGRAMVEVSGNVSLEKTRGLAASGVDFISVGALTHSAPAADISMKLLYIERGAALPAAQPSS